MQYPERVPAPVLYQAVLEGTVNEQAVICGTQIALPLCFVSLPQLDFLSVADGLQVACISCPAFALMFPLLAEHVEMSGGTVDYGEEDAG